MTSRRVILTVRAESGCPLYAAGDTLTLHLPSVDVRGSSAVCALTVAKLMSSSALEACPDTRPPMESGTFKCPRAERPVVFDVETVAETYLPEPTTTLDLEDVPSTVAQLRRVAVFRALPARVLGEIAKRLTVETYDDSAVLVEKGHPGRAFFILLEGQVEIVAYAEEEVEGVVNMMGAPACFGEMSLLTGSLTAARVTARGEARVFVLPAEHFHRMLGDHPEMAQRFTRLLAARVETANALIVREGSQGFRGKLTVMGVSTVLQVMSEARQSGTLHFSDGGHRATVGYNDGRVFAAHHGEMDGAEAVFELLTWEHGSFWLEADPVPTEDTIEIGITGLLLEGMRRLDEGRA